MKQRVALLRTYMFEKEVIILDEPFSSLDAITRRTMHKWYLDIVNKHEKSTIFITHDIDEAILLANRIYILSGTPGEIVAEIEITDKKGSEFNISDKFMEYKKKVLELMED